MQMCFWIVAAARHEKRLGIKSDWKVRLLWPYQCQRESDERRVINPVFIRVSLLSLFLTSLAINQIKKKLLSGHTIFLSPNLLFSFVCC